MSRPGTGIGLGHNHASYFRIQARDRSGAGPGKLIEFPIAVIVFAGFFPEVGGVLLKTRNLRNTGRFLRFVEKFTEIITGKTGKLVVGIICYTPENLSGK